MTLKQFCEDRGLSKPTLCICKEKTYDDSKAKIHYMKLSNYVGEAKQDVLIFSKGLAEAYVDNKGIIKTAEVSLGEDGKTFFLIRPATVDTVDFEW